ncbi:5-hydroxyisourate hydrolase [Rhizocola hellebori]|uniref:5-hydroxyisourate hydrolase n=1 Tax=Rhizocola hellebori TaxID=1392758 RepID=A0A8J3Q8K6_9ACTN|nr:hydroxyisourate hydrolase [Rhizocola hellebori]GIH05434.1 5-hydroxyisourate hydrolase [Rhizocola hellebori]
MTVSTHVLDAALGRPVPGLGIRLEHDGAVTQAQTDADGRVASLPTPGNGVYRLVFDLGDRAGFYPEVVIAFRVTDPAAHYHVPLLLSPFAYSTYRGS